MPVALRMTTSWKFSGIDTVNVVDSIPVVTIKEVTKEVNKLHNWQSILMVLGGGFIAVIGYKLIRIIKI